MAYDVAAILFGWGFCYSYIYVFLGCKICWGGIVAGRSVVLAEEVVFVIVVVGLEAAL